LFFRSDPDEAIRVTSHQLFAQQQQQHHHNNNNSQSGIDAIKSSFSRDPSNYHQPPRTRNRDGQAS
jgi:hypothetical protein